MTVKQGVGGPSVNILTVHHYNTYLNVDHFTMLAGANTLLDTFPVNAVVLPQAK